MRMIAFAALAALVPAVALAQPSGVDVRGNLTQTTTMNGANTAVNIASPGARAVAAVGVIYSGVSVGGNLTQTTTMNGANTAANIASPGARASALVGVINAPN